jgi:hypothetical protein
MIEFALCLALFWTPLFLGTYQIGFNLIRAVQVTQICRDAGHMYSRGVDLSNPQYQSLLLTLMPSAFTMSSTGNTVLYISKITFVDDAACKRQKLQPNSSSCPNFGKAVFMQQIPLGDKSLRDGDFGTPSKYNTPGGPSSIMDANYNIAEQYFVRSPAAVASNFLSLIPMNSSLQYAFMSEMYVQSNDISFSSYLGTSGEYARSVF